MYIDIVNFLKKYNKEISYSDISLSRFCWNEKLIFTQAIIVIRAYYDLSLFDAQFHLLRDPKWKRLE